LPNGRAFTRPENFLVFPPTRLNIGSGDIARVIGAQPAAKKYDICLNKYWTAADNCVI